MNNFELINEFLDGALSSTEEEQLFAGLSSDSELRYELKQQLAIKSAIKSDVGAFTPKAESTLSIFNELGLIAPVSVASAGAGNSFVNFLKLNSTLIYTGVISSIATIAVMLLLLDFDMTNSGNSSDHNPKHSSKVDLIKPVETYGKNTLNSGIYEDKSSLKAEPVKVVYKYIYVNEDNKNKQQNISDLAEDNNQNQSFSSIWIDNQQLNDEYSFFDKSIYKSKQGNFANTEVIPIANLWSEFSQNKNFSFEVRGSEYQQNDIRTSNKNDFILPNTGFSFLYKISDEMKIGLDYRRENFYQSFSGFEDGQYFLFEQKPDLVTISMMLKYNPEFLQIYEFKPFLSANIGGNIAGPVGRLMIGSDIYLNNYMYFNLGVDYNLLMYKQNGNNFISGKPGFHIGAGINF
ncbi:hypothetical protein MASR1M45_03600 [Candidatus Kapaibacterium sp.]